MTGNGEGSVRDAKPFVVVAGFGAAGASAAVSAAQAGADVLVVDRAPAAERGGSTRYNKLYMLLDDTRTRSAEFVSEVGGLTSPWSSESGRSPETAGFWGLDAGFVKTWIEQSIPTIEWIEALGQTFSYQESDIVDPGVAPGVIPDGGGRGLLDLLEEKACELGVEFAYETALVDLLLDETGAVSGVVLESGEGRRTLDCKALVLATGGFNGNQELMTRYIGTRAHLMPPISKGGYYNRGEALRLGLAVGAATAGDLSDWHAVALDARGDGERALLTGFKLGLLVNRAGVRFADESLGEPAVKLIREQVDGLAFSITDARTRRHRHFENRFATSEKPVTADTIDELAGKIGVPVEALRRTVFEYNAASDWDTEDGRNGTMGLPIAKVADAVPLVEAPFEAWPVRAGMVFSLGGLKVDEYGRVLSLDSRPINGLYAAGDTVGGYFRGYVTYTTSIKAVVLGRIGAEHAVGYAAKGS